MKRASADLHVVGLHHNATAFCPKLLQAQNQILKCRSGHDSYQSNPPENSRYLMWSEAVS